MNYQAPRIGLGTQYPERRTEPVRAIRAAAFLIATLLVCSVGTLYGEDDWDPPLVPAPQPFSLNSYDAIDAVLMLRRARLLQYRYADGSTEIIPVESVYSFWVGFDPAAYENHQNRYDLMLNGEPIDWGNLFVEYGGEMLNLQLLYTYRNQRPVPDVRYRNPSEPTSTGM
jgi:hypothetical protein